MFFIKGIYVVFFTVFNICCCSLFCFSQVEEKEFIHLSTKDGLTDNTITALAQDRFGYIWIGTEQGLNRVDGKNTLQFLSDSSKSSLPSDEILDLHWVDSNNMAVCTRSGLAIINIQTMEQENLLVPAGALKEEIRVNKLRGILTDKEGNYFIITRTGFYQFNSKKQLVFRYDDYTAKQLAEQGTGFGIFFGWLDENNIIVTGQRGKYCYNKKTMKFSKIPGVHPDFFIYEVINKLGERNYAVRQILPGQFIVLFYESDTAYYIDENIKLNSVSRLPIFPLSNEINWRSQIYSVNDSIFYLSGKNSGIFKFQLNKKTGHIDFDTSKFLTNQKCNEILIDRENRIWVATNASLLMKNKNAVKFQELRLPKAITDKYPLASIMQVSADENNIYATGTLSGEFYIFSKVDFNEIKSIGFEFPPAIPQSTYAIKKFGPDTILCGGAAGLNWYNLRNKTKGSIDLPGWDTGHDWITNIFEDSKKNLWISLNKVGGCYIYKSETRKCSWFSFKEPEVKNLQTVWRMAEDNYENIWMGGNGLARYNTKKKMFDRYIDSFPALKLQAKGISAMAIDNENNLWLGNTSNGLLFFEAGKNRFTGYSQADGLPDNNLMALQIIDSTLWISCKSGLARMDLKTRKIFRVTSSKETSYNNLTGNTIFYDSYSRMLYTGAGSQILQFSSVSTSDNREPPVLLIEKVVFGKDSVVWNPSTVFHTNWGNKNIIVTFNAINYNDAEDQRFAYRIVNGENSGWILTGEERSIVFSNLSAGKHVLELKVYSLNNWWSEQVITFAINIQPPFWKTVWFYFLVALILAGSIYFIFRYRVNQLKKIIKVRSKISQDLHDEVGATLSGISMYSYLTRVQIKNKQLEEVEKSLKTIEQSAGDMVNKLNDIVWVVNPRHDSLKQLIQKLEDYALEMAVVKGIKVYTDIQTGIEDMNLPMESRRNIYLICKEAINNAVKYSGASILEIRIHPIDHTLEFLIKDNGKGFDSAAAKKGDGLENMQKRADEIGAKLILQSKDNEGASVSLQYKIT
jgi:ligand-binding sensor domain-containing protein/two-component sensor histidine kinase